MPRLIKL